MKLTSLRFRIKDGTARKVLSQMASSVNFVWNYCNESNIDSQRKFGNTLSAFDLNNLTSGCSKELGLHSQTVQAVCEEYAKSCKQHKRKRLSWRTCKRSLGWIPFKGSAINIENDSITYFGHQFKFWKSRDVEGKVRFGSFHQDPKGYWHVNLVIGISVAERQLTGKDVGIDLGLKTLITLSSGFEFTRENLTKKHEHKLYVAQRANKKRLVTAIHAKIKNQRKDWNHKISSLIVAEYDKIIVGGVSSSRLKKTRMAKSVSDAGWYDFKRMLAYKAMRLGSEYKEVNESYSTVTCSTCNERSGPKGRSGLSVREWVCSHCGSRHDRDVNAAKNILSFSLRGIVGH